MKHIFCVLAYKHSPYMEECILSLLNQKIASNIIISTSTPNNNIFDLAKKYNIPVYVNEVSKGIASDWNYALSVSEADLVTLVHQDDIYEPNYTFKMFESISNTKDVLIFFQIMVKLYLAKKKNIL